MPHGNEKKDSDRRRDILKEERTSERKTRQESEKMDNKNQCYLVSGHRRRLSVKGTGARFPFPIFHDLLIVCSHSLFRHVYPLLEFPVPSDLLNCQHTFL